MIAAMAKHGLVLLGLCAFLRAQTQPAADVTRDVKNSVQAVDPSVHPEVDGQPIAPTDADTRPAGKTATKRQPASAFWPNRVQAESPAGDGDKDRKDADTIPRTSFRAGTSAQTTPAGQGDISSSQPKKPNSEAGASSALIPKVRSGPAPDHDGLLPTGKAERAVNLRGLNSFGGVDPAPQTPAALSSPFRQSPFQSAIGNPLGNEISRGYTPRTEKPRAKRRSTKSSAVNPSTVKLAKDPTKP